MRLRDECYPAPTFSTHLSATAPGALGHKGTQDCSVDSQANLETGEVEETSNVALNPELGNWRCDWVSWVRGTHVFMGLLNTPGNLVRRLDQG